MLVGLLRRELPAAAHLLDERVVLGQALEVAAAQPVGARVADVRDRDLVGADVGGRQRRAHPGAILAGLGHLVDAGVRLEHALGEQLLGARRPGVPGPALERLDRELRGDLAGLRAAHPVGDDEEGGRAKKASSFARRARPVSEWAKWPAAGRAWRRSDRRT